MAGAAATDGERRGRGRPPRGEDEFLDATRPVFARHGLDGSSMEDLAAAAKTTKPTLYTRFGSKDELYERAVRREADAFIADVLDSYEQAEGLTVRDSVERLQASWFAYLDPRPDVLRLLFAPDRSPAAQRIADEVEERIVAALARSTEQTLARTGRSAPAQARFLAAMVFGATLHATRDNARTSGLSTDDAVGLSSSFIYAGYRGLDERLLSAAMPTAAPAQRRGDGR